MTTASAPDEKTLESLKLEEATAAMKKKEEEAAKAAAVEVRID